MFFSAGVVFTCGANQRKNLMVSGKKLDSGLLLFRAELTHPNKFKLFMLRKMQFCPSNEVYVVLTIQMLALVDIR